MTATPTVNFNVFFKKNSRIALTLVFPRTGIVRKSPAYIIFFSPYGGDVFYRGFLCFRSTLAGITFLVQPREEFSWKSSCSVDQLSTLSVVEDSRFNFMLINFMIDSRIVFKRPVSSSIYLVNPMRSSLNLMKRYLITGMLGS